MNNTYDLLFSDLEGSKTYELFIKKHAKGKSLLEFASGTGDLLNLLDQTYDVMGVDLDESMLQSAIEKYPQLKNKMKVGNFLNYQNTKTYDTVICVGDSLNYMDDLDEMDQFVEVSSALSDLIIVDFHHPYRLSEFEEPYFEEGSIDDFDYAYQIEKHEDRLIHTINYLDGRLEQVYQWVFKPEDLISRFKAKGYTSQIFTDFEHQGILEEGEKIMCIFSKVKP